MKGKKIKNSKKRKTAWIFVLVSLCFIIFLTNFFLEDVRSGGIFEWMISSFLLLFIAPLFIIKKIFKEDFEEYLLKSRLNKKNTIISLSAMIIFIAVMALFVVKLGWKENLMISSWVMMEDVQLMLFVDLLILPVVIFAKEFFFRGFAMKNLMPVVGVYGAIILQALLLLIYEMGIGGMISWKSMILILIPNIFFGFIAYKNKSILVSTVFHWIYILALDIYFYSQFIS